MADRYWVGGSGNWSDNTNHWSATSGGSPGASTPGTGDNVIFDTLSNATAYTVTIDATSNCLGFTLGDPLAGHVTLAGSSALSVFASFSVVAATVWTYTGSITFKATSGTQTLTFNGVTPTSSMIFNGVGGTWQLQDTMDLSTDGVRDITLTNGTLDTNGKTVKSRQFSSNNSNTRVLTLGATTWTLTDAWNVSTAGTGLTLNANTSSLVMSGSPNFTGGGKTYYNVQITTIDPHTMTGANTFNNLTILNNVGAGMDGEININADITVNGTFTVTGTDQTTALAFISSTIGTARTITAAAVSLSNVIFRDITGAGAATWSGTNVGDAGGNSGITFRTPVTRYWVGNGGNWSDTAHWSTSSGGSSGATVPLPQDTVLIDANSISSSNQTINILAPHAAGFNTTGVLNTPKIQFCQTPVGKTSAYSSITAVGVTFVNSGTLRMGNRSAATLTTGGVDIGYSLIIESVGSTVTLGSNYITPSGNYRPFTLSTGTFNAAGYNLTLSTLTNNSGSTRTLTMGSGTWTLNGTGTVLAQSATGLTLSAASSTIVVADTSATSKTVQGLGLTYGTLTVSGDNVILQGSNTFTTVNVNNAGLSNGLKFTAGITTTVTNFTTNGSSGNLAKILTTSAGSAATLTTGSSRISVDYMSIKDSTATQANTWYAGANSTNVSGNTNWLFTAPPASGGGGGVKPSRTQGKQGLQNIKSL